MRVPPTGLWELLGRELNLFTEKKELGKPGDFDHMTDQELIEFIEAQVEVVRELERQLLPHQPEAAQRCYQALGSCRRPRGDAHQFAPQRLAYLLPYGQK